MNAIEFVQHALAACIAGPVLVLAAIVVRAIWWHGD